MATDLIGKIINNQFRVENVIDSQRTGSAYAARNLMDDMPLVMNLVQNNFEDNPAIYNEVVRTANALSKLTHPNILPFYGLYQSWEFNFTLEKFIDGSRLDQLLREQEGKRLTIQSALIILKAISAALVNAHTAGIVHGDIKPENVIVSKEGNIYLTGFKIDPPANLTLETISGESKAPATDIYAQGALLFEILTGERLFRIPSDEIENYGLKLAERIRQAQLTVPQPNLSYSISEISAGLAQVIFKALQKNPADRYNNSNDLIFAVCTSAGVFTSEVPDQLWSEIPISGAATVTHKLLRDKDNLSDGIFPSQRTRYFHLTPTTAPILGAMISILLIGGFLFYSDYRNGQKPARILPGYAYIEDGEVMYQIPGGQPKLFKKGTNLSIGPGSIIKVGRNMTTLLLPGDYSLIIAGDPVTELELLQVTNNQSMVSVVKLHQGSLFLIANGSADENRPVYIQTVSGQATLKGRIMGNHFDSSTQTFAVDCVEGACQLEADGTVNLVSGQRSQVDSSGIPDPPSPLNLGLYSGYKLNFIPLEILPPKSKPSHPPQATPTPHPTIQFSATPIPPTWTPIPTAIPKTGYGQ